MSKKSIIKGALFLTVAGIITRLLGFVYRVYMSNLVGAEGMGLYQLIMPVYSLAWSISCSGFTTTISKLTAQEKAKKEYGNITLILKNSIIMSTMIGLCLSVLLYFSADLIALTFFKDERIILSLKILAGCFPFMAFGSCMRGYFFGLQEPIVPAINQVLEQVVRMSVIFFLSGFFITKGLEYACAVAVMGILAEEIFSFVYILFSYKKYKKKNNHNKTSLKCFNCYNMILVMAIPLTLNRVTSSLLSTVENVMIPQRLQVFGFTAKEAITTYGQLTGMAMPLIYFPSALLMALSISLVPAISEASAINNNKMINTTISKTMLFTNVMGIGMAGLFITFAKELGIIIYNQDIEKMLLSLGLMCPFLYIQMSLSGILNGLGYQLFIFRNSILSSIINLIFIYFLIPVRGVTAFIFGWFVSLIIVTCLELEKLKSSVNLNIQFGNWFFKPILSIFAACLTLNLIAKKFLFIYFGNALAIIIASFLLLFFYIIFIIFTGCLSFRDIQSLIRLIKPKALLKD